MNTVNATVQPTTPRLTLKEAVVNAVKELKVKGSFSAYDVTSAVRDAVNGGEINLPGLEARDNQNGIKYWVNHEDVKQVIKNLLNDGTLDNLGLTNVSDNGTFLVYEFAGATPAPSVTISPVSPTVKNPTQSPLDQRIESYIAKVGSATLKQIQSALKVNGVTCKDFANIMENLGYAVTPGTPDCYSTYVVS